MNTEDFKIKAREVHGNKYDYSKVEYINSKTKVCIICPEHGEFWQLPTKHLKGQECSKCSGRFLDRDFFIEKARNVHGDKYDYSKVEYVNNKTKVCIICPEHGEFWQAPTAHLSGKRCPKCAGHFMNTKYFIEKATKVHGNKYDYSKVNYVNDDTKVCIICPEHGKFWQNANSHLSGCGCAKCAGHFMDTEYFIEKAKKIHSNKYDYSKVEYVNNKTKVCIICPEHGEFWQKPSEHLSGCGCAKCALINRQEKRKLSLEEFLKRANEIHNNKYIYNNLHFKNERETIEITCPIHGNFQQTVEVHLRGCNCPKCAVIESKSEKEIASYLESINVTEIIKNNRKLLNGKELDIYIPSKHFAIEYNGLYWHSEDCGKDKTYHYDKMIRCQEQGIKLVQIFEDEYINNKEIVLSKIRHLLGIDIALPKIFGRKCIIKEINYKIAKEFLDKNHIQGGAVSTIYLGAYYLDKLIGVMQFKQETKCSNNWELTRFASDNNYICCGVGGKLFKYFVRNYNPHEIKSFADRRWTIDEENNIYLQLGFEFDSYTKPDYQYVVGNKRVHKFNFRKERLHKTYGLPLTMTEKQMTEILKIFKIWNCGLIKYVWKN